MALSTIDIDGILRGSNVSKDCFLGAYPACMYPMTRKSRYSFITNTDDHMSGGVHWNAWFVDGDVLSFFDSFGRSHEHPDFPGYYKHLAERFKETKHSIKQIQSFGSWTCGHFCVNYIYTLCLGLDYMDFLDNYSENLTMNDIFVLDFINSII